MAMVRVLCAILVLAVVTMEAAKIETFDERGCHDSPTNTFYLGSGCQRFNDQASVCVTEISSNTRVSFHNQKNCEGYSSVGESSGPICFSMGKTKLRAAWIQGCGIDSVLESVVEG